MDQVRTFLVKIGTIAFCLVALGLGDRALAAEEQSAGEAAGAGRLSRETQEPPVICGGCVAPSHASQGKGSITPYGRIELDAIYSTRNTNPLDPGQFNGYATAAGKSSNTSATFNPRYSVFGVRADRTDGTHVLMVSSKQIFIHKPTMRATFRPVCV